MTEEAQKPAAAASAAAPEEVTVVVPEVPAADKQATEKDPLPAPEPEPEVADKAANVATETAVEAAAEGEATEEKTEAAEVEKVIAQSVSFKEESYVVGELPESQKKALEDIKQLVREALDKHEFTEVKKEEKKEEKAEKKEEEAEKKEEKKEEEAEKKEEEAEKTEAEAAEEPKEEENAPEPEKKEEKAPAPEPEAVVAAAVEEKISVAVDDDGAKTVEAIEKTVVVAVEEAKKEKEEAEAAPAAAEEVEIWGIPLLADERSDVVLLKFLRARDYKVKEAFAMLKNTVRWRKQFGIEALLVGGEDIGSHLSEAAFSHGVDKEGHPVCYNVFGAFHNKELYHNTFGDDEKRSNFIKWRILFLEKSIRKFDFDPAAISTIVQVNDLKNSPGLLKRELNQSTEQALKLLQDNYPEFVAKQVFINVPWWYLAFHKVISTFLTQRTKSKLVLAGPSKSAETLFKYIAPEQVPVQYGGLSRDDNTEFTASDPVTQVPVKPASKHIIEIPVAEETGQVVWEIRVVGWDVTYGAEFVPTAENHYTVIVQKARKISPAEETVISNSFKVTEPGKIVLTIDNQSSKKKLVLYRFKTKPGSE